MSSCQNDNHDKSTYTFLIKKELFNINILLLTLSCEINNRSNFTERNSNYYYDTVTGNANSQQRENCLCT